MRPRSGVALLLLCAGAVVAQAPGNAIDPKAQTIFDRTRETRATYSNYSWNWVRDPDGAVRQGWSAEFHKGSLHRVETPEVRVVADCVAGTGTALFVAEGRTETDPGFARAACGIDSNRPIGHLDWIDRRNSRFGAVDRIRVTDDVHDRVYAVSGSGVLVAAEYFAVAPGSKECVQAEAMAVEADLPAENIFSPESLKHSVVPEKYRERPPAPAAGLWIAGFACA